MLPAGYCVHAVPGRVRYRIPERRGDNAFFDRLQQVLADTPGVRAVAVNAGTAGVLLEFDGELEQMLAAVRAAGLFRVMDAMPQSLAFEASAGLKTVDRNLSLITGGRLDLDGALVFTLIGLALHQALRGQWLAPASTLFWYAVTLLRQGDKNR